mgnify:CR=1 FL=1
MATFPRLPTPLTSLLVLGLVLAGCSASTDLAVKCPEIRIPQNTERLTRFREGDGRDITDVRLQAEVTYLSGACTVDDEAIEVTFPIAVAAQRGPANSEGLSNVMLFVAVATPEREILSRRELPLRLTFPGNKVRIIAREPITVEIPKTEEQTSKDFKIFLGFVLTRGELDYNRTEDRLGG